MLYLRLWALPGFAQKIDSSVRLLPGKYTSDQLRLPFLLISAGIAINGNNEESVKNEIVEERNEMIPHFKTTIDNYLQFSPLLLLYGFEAFHMQPKTSIKNRTAIMLKSELIMVTSVMLLKNTISDLRPDNSARNSFPSGHTAQAFAAAAMLSEEYGYRYKWVPYLSYGLAGSVGMLRMANNKHYLSDVLVAAGLGILSTKVAYWTHRYRWDHTASKTFTL